MLLAPLAGTQSAPPPSSAARAGSPSSQRLPVTAHQAPGPRFRVQVTAPRSRPVRCSKLASCPELSRPWVCREASSEGSSASPCPGPPHLQDRAAGETTPTALGRGLGIRPGGVSANLHLLRVRLGDQGRTVPPLAVAGERLRVTGRATLRTAEEKQGSVGAGSGRPW